MIIKSEYLLDLELFYNISITFDSLVLEALEVTQGSFLRRFGITLWDDGSIMPGAVNDIYEALFSSPKAGVGSGTLFSVKFKVIGTDNSQLHFAEVDFTDPDAYLLPCFTLLDGWYGSQNTLNYGEFQISNDDNYQALAQARWIGNISKYCVVWQDMRSGNYDIYGQLVNPDGTLSGANYAVIDSVGNQLEPAVAYNPTGFFKMALVVWTDYRRGADSADIYGRFLYNGNPVTNPEFAIAHHPGFQYNPQIARCGSRYLVIWQDIKDDSGIDTSHIYGQLLTNTGSTIGSPIKISPVPPPYDEWYDNYNFSPAIAAGDSAFLIVWHHYYRRAMQYHQLRSRLIDTLGNIGDIVTIVEDVPYPDYHFQPSCAFDGSNYLVVWAYTANGELQQEIKGQLVSGSGILIDTNFIIYEASNGFVHPPRVNFDGSNYLVVWDEEVGDGADYIKGRRVAPDGSLIDNPFILCSAPYQQTFPSCAMGTSSIVVWQDYRNGTDYDIWGYLGPPIGRKEQNIGCPFADVLHLEVYPNPFSKQTKICFGIEPSAKNTFSTIPSALGIHIYDAAGRLVKSFKHAMLDALSPKQISWDGTDNTGMPVKAGVYFVVFGNRSSKVLHLK